MGLLTSEISTKTMVPLCRQLATAYDAGLPILRTLDIVGRELKDKNVKMVLTTISDDVRKGKTLAEAASAQSKFLPPVFIYLLRGGEIGGKLDVMLRDLADYYEDRLEIRRQIIGSLVYPGFQLILAWFVGSFAIPLIKQVMSSITDRGGKAFNLERYFQEYCVFQSKAMLCAAALFGVFVVLSRMGVLSSITAVIRTRVWPISVVATKFAMARFYRTFALLLGSGVGIVACIEHAAASSSNLVIERELLKAVDPVRKGMTLTQAFGRSKYVSRTAIEMIQVGEESGKLETQLRKASEYALNEAQHATQIATRVMSTGILIIVAGIVGYVVISFYSQLYGRMFDELGV